jgi:hypothetical protein
MRVEGDDGRRQTCRNRSIQDPPVAEMDSVEGPDRDRAGFSR